MTPESQAPATTAATKLNLFSVWRNGIGDHGISVVVPMHQHLLDEGESMQEGDRYLHHPALLCGVSVLPDENNPIAGTYTALRLYFVSHRRDIDHAVTYERCRQWLARYGVKLPCVSLTPPL